MAFSIYFFLFFIPCGASLSFNFTKISPVNENRDIVTEGDGAYISVAGIQVTPDDIASNRTKKAGRATYIRPLHLWDTTSRELASFTTQFSFLIDSNSTTSYAEGLAFFLARNNSVITAGGAMGLPVNTTTNFMTSPFLAVEFDTHFDHGWDPESAKTTIGNHVGININSLNSTKYEKWLNNVTDGRECHAWINYDSVFKNLTVSFTAFEDGAFVRHDGLSYIIDLRYVLPEWVIFGFSAATGPDRFQTNNVKSWAFNSSDLQIDRNNTVSPTSNPENSPDVPINNEELPSKGKSRKGYAIGLIVVTCVLVTFLALLGFLVWRKKKMKGDEGVEHGLDFEMGTQPRRFYYHELARATANFEDKLGEGGWGGVYKGFLEDSGTYVAVKRFSKSSRREIKDCQSAVQIISRLRHKNLLQLAGWCHEGEEFLLVYEYMENGSLYSHLFGTKSLLAWRTRYQIAKGLASALLYLHEEWEQGLVHRNIKSSNVMLDNNFNAKLGYFEFAKNGSLAPECEVTSKESDVCSFGVVALEMACGRNPMTEQNQIGLLEWVWGHYGTRTLLEIADPRLGVEFEEKEMERLMIVALWSTHPDSKCRPSMRQVVQLLNFEVSPPILQKSMPVGTYFAPPTCSMSVSVP